MIQTVQVRQTRISDWFQAYRRSRGLLSGAVLLSLLSTGGCQREWYREQADGEVSCLIEEKAAGRSVLRIDGLEMDPRSRFHDPYDQVRPPMPPDDPDSHEFMHRVDGMKQWSHWHDNGDVSELENPDWRVQLVSHAETDARGTPVLKLDDTVRIALINSPNYQQQIETLYLSALDVSTERFRFDTQFFGGAGTGSGGRTFFNTTTGTITGSEFDNGGTARNGQSSAGVGANSNIQLRRNLATAGEIVVGLANSLVWQFDGSNTNFASSLINFSFVQPLLRAGGRNIALEQLTIAERTLLANVRAFEHYRQGFYTQIAIGDNGTTAPRRRGGFTGGSGLSGFTGQGSGGFGAVGDATGFGRGGGGGGSDGGGGTTGGGFAGGGAGTVGGFIGLLQRRQQIRNAENALRAQQQTLQLLEAHLEAGLIDIAQVDQFRQSIETQRANLLQSRNGYQDTLDGFKVGNLGLPPDVELDVSDELIRPFQFLSPEIENLQTSAATIIEEFGDLPEVPDQAQVDAILTRLASLRPVIEEQLDAVTQDVERIPELRDKRAPGMSAAELREFDAVQARLLETLQMLRTRFAAVSGQVDELKTGLTAETLPVTIRSIIGINVDLTNLLGELALTQTRARVETITIDPIQLDSKVALEIARANRLDWMNNRAALVDTWRLIEFNANRLESNLDIFFNGSMGTIGDNAVKFGARDTTISAGVRFDAPFNRLVERNDFRQQLIVYQQARRGLIQYEDGINGRLRSQLRELDQLQTNLEIQRRSVAIAIRRVDQTRENLSKPAPPAAPGAPQSQFGPTAAVNLLTALSDLRSSQDNFMSVWLNYYAGRMRLMRELGLFRLDDRGIWIEEPLDQALRATSDEHPLPPDVPQKLIDDLGREPAPADSAPADPVPSDPAAAAKPVQPNPVPPQPAPAVPADKPAVPDAKAPALPLKPAPAKPAPAAPLLLPDPKSDAAARRVPNPATLAPGDSRKVTPTAAAVSSPASQTTSSPGLASPASSPASAPRADAVHGMEQPPAGAIKAPAAGTSGWRATSRKTR